MLGGLLSYSTLCHVVQSILCHDLQFIRYAGIKVMMEGLLSYSTLCVIHTVCSVMIYSSSSMRASTSCRQVGTVLFIMAAKPRRAKLRYSAQHRSLSHSPASASNPCAHGRTSVSWMSAIS